MPLKLDRARLAQDGNKLRYSIDKKLLEKVEKLHLNGYKAE